MAFFDAEMVEMIMISHPEYFTAKKGEITIYENATFGQIEHKKEVTGSKAEDILYTAKAIQIKYGRDRAINYLKNVIKKGA